MWGIVLPPSTSHVPNHHLLLKIYLFFLFLHSFLHKVSVSRPPTVYTLAIDSLSVFQLCTSTYSVHAGILKLWRGRVPCPLVVYSSHYGSRLPSSFVRSQLTLPVPTMRIRSPLPQDGAPIHRVRTHSPSRVRDNNHQQHCHSLVFTISIVANTAGYACINCLQWMHCTGMHA